MKFGISFPGPVLFLLFVQAEISQPLFKPRGGQIQIPFYSLHLPSIYWIGPLLQLEKKSTLVFCMYHLSNSRSFIHDFITRENIASFIHDDSINSHIFLIFVLHCHNII